MTSLSRRLSCLLVCFSSLLFAGEGNWLTNFEEAKKKATAEQKDLVVNFTGSDWCGWCIRLQDEVFKHTAFHQGVAEKFILVEVDFPQDESKISREVRQQNERLQEAYAIEGFPTILLMDAQGRPYAQTGYEAGGPAVYLRHLEALQALRVQRDQALATAESLAGVPKASALMSVLEKLPEGSLPHYDPIVEEIRQLDPDDETGFVAAQKRKAARAALEENIMTAMHAGEAKTVPGMIDDFIDEHQVDGKEKQELLQIKLQIQVSIAMQAGEGQKALELVDEYVKVSNLEGEEKQRVLGMKISLLLGLEQFDEVEPILDAIITLDPETEIAKQAAEFRPQLAAMKKAATKPAGTTNPPCGEPGHVHNH